MREVDHDPVRHVGARGLHDLEREQPRIAVLDREDERARVEAARGQHLVDDAREAV